MDTSSSGHSNPDPGVKKSPFDDLNKEELISKCKGLLAIAQKAKLAKTELISEIESYKLQLEKCESEKHQSLENNKILQELVDSLTEQKLNIITEVDSAQSKIKNLSVQCKNYEQEINKYKAELIIRDQNISDVLQKLSDLDSELISFKRQNKRLMDENEQLINQLTEIEARTAEFNDIGLEQREQLKLLEQNILTDKENKARIEVLNNNIQELEDQLKTIEEQKSKQISEYENKIYELTQSCELEKNKREKVNVKLKSYKDKILKCATCINQLKNSRYILTKTVKEYSENIPKWQNDIIKASKVLDNQVITLKSENVSLNEKVIKLEELLKQTEKAEEKGNFNEANRAQLDELKNENSQLQAEIAKLKQQFIDNSCYSEKLQQELFELKDKYEQLIETELPLHVAEKKSLNDQINDNIINLNTLTEKNKELIKALEELNIENEKLSKSLQNNNAIESLTLQIKALESEKSTLVKEKLNAKDSVIELENINKGLSEQITSMEAEIQTMKAQVNSNIVQEKNDVENKHKNDMENNILKCKLMEQQEKLNSMKKEYDDIQDLNNLLKEEVETLKFSLEQPKDDSEHSDLNVSLQTDIVKLETKLAAYKQENSSLLIEMKESRNKIKGYDILVSEHDDAKSKLISYKNENAELLHEMKEINQVLKERGELISKQQKAIAEMERLIETLEKDRNSLNEENTVLHEKIEALENEVRTAEKKTIENSGVMDQIKIERDNSIKKISENECLIASLKEEVEKLKQTPSSDLPNEDMSTSTISKAEEFSRMKDLDETFEEKYTKLRIFALKLKKKLNETTTVLQNTEQDKAKLEKMLVENQIKSTVSDNNATQNESENNRNDQLEVIELNDKINSLTEASEKISTELEKVKVELNLKNQELSSEIEAHKVTKDNLEKAKRDVKKKNVLSLEIEDYERSLKELTTKMDEKKKKMVQMESTIDTQEGTITAMKTQIKLLEEQIKADETQNRLTKEELQHIIEEGKDKDSIIQAKNGIISKLEQDLEDEKRKNEEADLEMTALMSDKQKVIMSLGEEKAVLNHKVKKLEFRCAELNETLKIVNMELADLKTEYTSYKVRAQAVLRQNQTVDHSQEEQLKEDAAAMRAQIESLTLKLSTAKEQCLEQSTEAENARRRAAEASSEAARAQQRTARLHADLTRLSQQLESERAQHKLQVSTLSQCYKTQISDLESRLQKETDVLKKQLAMALESAKVKGPALMDDSNLNQYMLPVIPKDDSDGEMDINVSMIPREEGEGSESAPSPPPSKPYLSSAGSGRSPVPLERLLEEGVPEDESLDTSSLALTSDQEISDLKRKLTAQQQRVKHVTVLLSESERECARMAQLSELLKAELRRVRGTSHNAHNAEYMKNVTLKFLTLPPGDERSRLVPVLQKILTLTNDETQKIHAIAKGLDPNPKGWGSYLPWPGGSK